MMEELLATAKAANLSKLEIPNKVHIDGNFDAGWLPDTGLVTDAFKVPNSSRACFYILS